MTTLPQGKDLDAVALRAQAGDKDALDVLLRGLERLLFSRAVVPAAKAFGLWHRQEDLVQMAATAAMHWLPRWDRSIAAVTTYLGTAARWELLRRGKKLAVIVHAPDYARELLLKVPAIRAKKDRGEALTEIEQSILAREHQLRAALRPTASIHPHDGDEGSTEFILGRDDVARETSDDRAEIRDLLGILPARERFVVERMYGFHDGNEWTLEEVAAVMKKERARAPGVRTVGNGLSRERVRQIEAKALSRMRQHLREAEHPKPLAEPA
jgi:DNA-directed RNA polymerase specialized sigma subunit